MKSKKPLTKDEILFNASRARKKGVSIEIGMEEVSLPGTKRETIFAGMKYPEELESSFCDGFRAVLGLRSAGAEVFSADDKERREIQLPTPNGEVTSLRLFKLVTALIVPSQILEKGHHANTFAQSVGYSFGLEIARKAENYFTNGEGREEPRGIAYGSESKPKMKFEEALLSLRRHESVSWMMRHETYWDTSFSRPHITRGPHHLSLLGYPVHFNDFLDPGVAIVGNFHSGYAIRDTGKAEMQIERDLKESGSVLLKLIYYSDGQVRDPEALIVFKPTTDHAD